jgi:hypothetical protein
VPLLIRGPGFRGGKTVRDMSINADLAPTILKATGATPAITEDGMALQGFAEKPGRERGRELSIEGGGFSGVRTSRYIYLEYFSQANTGFTEMYDLQNDPFELQNVAGDPAYAAARNALAARLAKIRGCSGVVCTASPHLRLKLKARHGPRKCDLRPVRLRVKGADSSQIVESDFYLNGKRFARDHKRPFERKLPWHRLKRRHHSKAMVLVTLLDGRELTINQHVRACR